MTGQPPDTKTGRKEVKNEGGREKQGVRIPSTDENQNLVAASNKGGGKPGGVITSMKWEYREG